MGLVVTCDNPDCPNAGEPMDQRKAVTVFMSVNDPETGPAETRHFFDTECGDKFLTTVSAYGVVLPE